MTQTLKRIGKGVIKVQEKLWEAQDRQLYQHHTTSLEGRERNKRQPPQGAVLPACKHSASNVPALPD